MSGINTADDPRSMPDAMESEDDRGGRNSAAETFELAKGSGAIKLSTNHCQALVDENVGHVAIARSSHMTHAQIEVIASVERRRRWSTAEKERLVASSLEPGATVSAVARTAGIHPSQLYGWRRQLCSRPQPSTVFAAIRVAREPIAGALPGIGMIEVEVANGSRMRITGVVDPALLTAAIAALSAGGRRR